MFHSGQEKAQTLEFGTSGEIARAKFSDLRLFFVPPTTLFPFGILTPQWAHPIGKFDTLLPLGDAESNRPSAGAAGGPPGTLIQLAPCRPCISATTPTTHTTVLNLRADLKSLARIGAFFFRLSTFGVPLRTYSIKHHSSQWSPTESELRTNCT